MITPPVLRKLAALTAMCSIAFSGFLTVIHDHDHGQAGCCSVEQSNFVSVANVKTACACHCDDHDDAQTLAFSQIVTSSDAEKSEHLEHCSICRMDYEESVGDSVLVAPDPFDFVRPATIQLSTFSCQAMIFAWLPRGPPQGV